MSFIAGVPNFVNLQRGSTREMNPEWQGYFDTINRAQEATGKTPYLPGVTMGTTRFRVGADTTKASDQAAALRVPSWSSLPKKQQQALQQAHQTGGPEAVAGVFGDNWGSLPDEAKVDLLSGASGGSSPEQGQ